MVKMDLNHLHLHVTELGAAIAFYEYYFRFRRNREHDGVVFLRNEDGFDLALSRESQTIPLPPGIHFGFRMPAPEWVSALHSRMVKNGVTISKELASAASFVSFRCQDVAKYEIEVYWEAEETEDRVSRWEGEGGSS